MNAKQAVLTTICRNEIGRLVHKDNNQWTVWLANILKAAWYEYLIMLCYVMLLVKTVQALHFHFQTKHSVLIDS